MVAPSVGPDLYRDRRADALLSDLPSQDPTKKPSWVKKVMNKIRAVVSVLV